MSASRKGNLLSTITAVICIILYAAAIAIGTGRVFVNTKERSLLAANEFNFILDRVSSAAIQGFMTESYQETILEAIADSQTILGVIISGSSGEYGFERQYGTVINWNGNSPRFKTGFGISRQPHFRSVWIEGQRNSTVQAIYSYIDYDLFIRVLKETLIIVFAVMALAVLILLLDINLNTARSRVKDGSAHPKDEEAASGKTDSSEVDYSGFTRDDAGYDIPDISDSEEHESLHPKGLYSPRGIGWESYTRERLESELHRCASLEEDLVLIEMKLRDSELDKETFQKLIAESANSFTLRDMIFENGDQGLALIIPAINLDQGIGKSEEFLGKVQNRLTDTAGSPPDICIGLSSRAGRLVEAERMMMEAGEALSRAMNDPKSTIIAFRSDPEKYRQFIHKKK